MSNNGGINISGIDFTKLPDDFNLSGVEDILHISTAKNLEAVSVGNDKKITLDDGLDKDETQYIIESINIDGSDDEITNEEINQFLKEVLQIEKPTETQINDITTLVQNIAIAAKDATSTDDTKPEEVDDSTKANNTAEEDEKQDNSGSLQVNVQSWGSAAEEGNKYANDCLDHIMKNYYQELTPYSSEWYEKETEIMNANPNIYGDENGVGARASINGGGRRNSVIHDGEAITLPGIAQQQEEGGETKSAGENGTGEEIDPAVNAAPQQIPDDAQELSEREKIDEENGIEVASYTDAEGNIIGKRQFNGESIMWESTIKTNEDGTTTETRSWTDSGNVQVIKYDSEGKELGISTVQQDGITSEAEYSYDSSGVKTGSITYSQDGIEIGTGTQSFDTDGSYSEHVEYTGGENAGQTIDTTYTKAGVTSSKTIEHTCGEDAGSGVKLSYENGLPLHAEYYDTNKETIGTIDYKYNEENGTRTELVTNLQDSTIAVIKYDTEGQEIDRCSFTYGEDGKPVGDIEGNADLLVEIGEPASQESEEDDSITTEDQEESSEDTKQAELRADIASARAQALHAAMDRAGTDEETVKEIINNVSGQDLVDVINLYEEMYSTTLEDAIKGDFSWVSGESDLLRKLDSAKSEAKAYENMIAANPNLNAPARTEINQDMVYEAQLLAFKAATSNRLGTDELVLFDMFQEMEDEELKSFIEYAKSKNVDVKTTIEDETSFETQKSLIQRIETLEGTQAKPRINVDAEASEERSMEQIRADIATTKAQALHAAMDRAGTDEETVKDIINNTTGQDLVDIINEYERLFGTTLEDAIKGDFSWVSGESDLLRKLDSAKSEAKAYENMIAANPDLNTPARTTVTLEDLHEAQLQAFKAATTNRLGTDEKIVYQMLQNGSMTDADIIALDKALKEEGSSLENVIWGEFNNFGSVHATLLRKLEKLGLIDKSDASETAS